MEILLKNKSFPFLLPATAEKLTHFTPKRQNLFKQLGQFSQFSCVIKKDKFYGTSSQNVVRSRPIRKKSHQSSVTMVITYHLSYHCHKFPFNTYLFLDVFKTRTKITNQVSDATRQQVRGTWK